MLPIFFSFTSEYYLETKRVKERERERERKGEREIESMKEREGW